MTLLTSKQAAAALGISEGTLRNWRTARIGLPFVKVGRRSVRYDAADVEAYVRKQKHFPSVRAHEMEEVRGSL